MKEEVIIVREIENLLKIGAICECKPIKDQFLSKIFVVGKPNGSYRFILNLKELNQFISTQHFKLEDYRTASNIITKNCYLANLDLKDAYFMISIKEDSRKYLRFQFKNKLYQFNVLPFGLSTAPFVFTKILKPAVSTLRSWGLNSVQYLDDFLCIESDYIQCKVNIEKTCNLLQNLGFIINKEKSKILPTNECSFLGFIFDSKHMTLKISEQKRKHNLELINSLLHKKQYTIRHLAKVLGSLTSICPAICYGWLYTKKLERHRYLSLQKHNDNYECKVSTPTWCIQDLNWWKTNIHKAVAPFKQHKYKTEIFSDASLSGWGASCNNKRIHGFWTFDEKQMHINVLELKATFLGLKTFGNTLNNCEILLRIDNTTAISYINRMGGVQFPQLHAISEQIWKWCEKRNIWLFASYISSKDNYIADSESRKHKTEIEWSLEKSTFDNITHNFGFPIIDLFASRLNYKCKKYVAWHRDPDAHAIDAFTVDWSGYFFYAFPPFSLILKTLRKIQIDEAEGIVVVPHWVTQPWYPLFMSMLVSKLMIIQPKNNLLCSDAGNLHPLRKNLRLAVGVLSGKHL